MSKVELIAAILKSEIFKLLELITYGDLILLKQGSLSVRLQKYVEYLSP